MNVDLDRLSPNHILRKMEEHEKKVAEAVANYNDHLDHIQSSCKHPTVLQFTNSDYLTIRVCEDCGYYERVQWDSSFRYRDKRLTKRAYRASHPEVVRAMVVRKK